MPHADAYDSALDQLRAYGLELDALDTSGTLRRVRHRDDRPSKKDGWYVAFEHLTASGATLVFGAYGWWKDPSVSHTLEPARVELAEAERRALERRRKEARQAAAAARDEIAHQAAQRSERIWAKLPVEGNSAYLQRKRVPAWGVRFARGRVVVPLRNGDGALVGLQWIGPDGDKRFITGTAKQGAFHLIGACEDMPTVAVAEGYATAATVWMATKWPTAVAFDAGNLLPVCRALKAAYPASRIIVCGDNDHKTEGNPGRAKGDAAAHAVGGIALYPDGVGTDWNDLYVDTGMDATREALRAQYSAAMAAARARKPDLRVVAGTEHDDRPVIRVVNGRLPQAVDAAEQALVDGGTDIFQHGNRLVRVGRWDAATGPVTRPTGSGVLIDISPEWLVDILTRNIRWERYDKRSDDWLPTDAPTRVAKTLLARTGDWPFSHLLGFCDSPTLDLAGRVVSSPGYDKASGLYLSAPPKIAPIETTSQAAAQRAAGMLFEMISTFPFVGRANQGAALALLMTAILRRVLPSAPIGCISASTPGTGKSLLADCISVLATGRTASVTALGKDNEELEKRLDSVLLKGDQICVWDNVDRAVKSDVLCQVATQSHKSVRVLAQSRIVEAPTNVHFLMTGNNITLIGDLTRRTVVVHMDAGCERPELRSFSRDAIGHMLKFRADGIRNVLIIAKAYLDAGCPDVSLPPFGSFEVWDKMVRRPLVWAGWPDPLQPAECMREQDHEFSGMIDLLAAWQAALGTGGVTAAELYDHITTKDQIMPGDWSPRHPALTDAAVTVLGSLGKWGARELGYRLRQWSERILGGRRVVNDGKGKRGVVWRVESVSN